jgi:hypothetical protein
MAIDLAVTAGVIVVLAHLLDDGSGGDEVPGERQRGVAPHGPASS